MSTLIDKMFKDGSMDTDLQEFGGRWFIAKPPNHDKNYVPFRRRLADALRVLCGMSIAVHYKIDEETP